MRITIGCDHRGLELKQSVIELITEDGHSYKDFGSHNTESVDYPDIAQKVAQAVASGKCKRGILICDTGVGMCIVANKVKGIRAALCCDGWSACQARRHNDVNILCLSEGVLQDGGTLRLPADVASVVEDGVGGQVEEIVNSFLTTQFSRASRHQRRVNKIRDMEG